MQEPVRLADRLHSTAIHILRRVRREDARSGLTPARLSALSVVVFAGPMKLGKLAEAEQVRPATMSRTVDALVESGLVTKRADEGDARALRIESTAEGTGLLQTARARRVHALVEGLEALEPGELEALDRALAALARAFDLPARHPVSRPGGHVGATKHQAP
jgi:DNA-binding MarR family transcriptional regulator